MRFEMPPDLRDESSREAFDDVADTVVRLRAALRPAIQRNRQNSSKVRWKVEAYVQAVSYRTVSLCEGTIHCWNQNNLLPAIILSRSVLETTAVAYDFLRKITRAVEVGDLLAVDAEANNKTFTSRYEMLRSESISSPNVLTLIDNLDKYLLEGRKSEKLMRDTYDMLSDYCHPNWLGTSGFYGRIDPDSQDHSFSFDASPASSFAGDILVALTGAAIIENCHQQIEIMLPAVDALSEEAERPNAT